MLKEHNEQVVIEHVEKMMQRSQHQLNFFHNRLVRSRFIELPKQRLIRTAEAQSRWFADEIEALSLELKQVESQYVTKVQIRETGEQDIRRIYPWLIQPEVWRALRGPSLRSRAGPDVGRVPDKPFSRDEGYARIHRWLMEPDFYPFSVERFDGTFIGFCLLRQMGRRWENNSGKLVIFAIHPQWRNLGYGTEALRKVMNYAFSEIGLSKVELLVESDNIHAVRCFERVGFQAVEILEQREGDQNYEFFEMELTQEGVEIPYQYSQYPEPLSNKGLAVLLAQLNG